MSRNATVVEMDVTGTSGEIPEGAESIGVLNVGGGDGYMSTEPDKGIIPAGVPKTFPACKRTYPVMYYNATATRLIITIVK